MHPENKRRKVEAGDVVTEDGTNQKVLLTPENLEIFWSQPEDFDPVSDLFHVVCDADGNNVLSLAIKNNHEKAFFFMLNHKCLLPEDINQQNAKGVTALAVAAHKGREHMVEAMLAQGAEVDIPNHNGSTALIQASHFGHVGIVSALIRAQAHVDRPNDKGTTALMRAAQDLCGIALKRPQAAPCV